MTQVGTAYIYVRPTSTDLNALRKNQGFASQTPLCGVQSRPGCDMSLDQCGEARGLLRVARGVALMRRSFRDSKSALAKR